MSGYVKLDRQLDLDFPYGTLEHHAYMVLLLVPSRTGPHPCAWMGGLRPLGRRMGVDHPTQLLRALKTLESAGWVARGCHPCNGQTVTENWQPCNGRCNGYRAMRQDDSGAFVTALVTDSVTPHACASGKQEREQDGQEQEEGASPLSAVPASEPAEPAVSPSKRKRAPKAPKPVDPLLERSRRFKAWWMAEYPRHHDGAEYLDWNAADNVAVRYLLGVYPGEDGTRKLAGMIRAAWDSPDPYTTSNAATVRGFRSIVQRVAAVGATPSRNGRSPAFSAIEERFRILERQTAEDMEKRGAP